MVTTVESRRLTALATLLLTVLQAIAVAATDSWETGDLNPSSSRFVSTTYEALTLCAPRYVSILAGKAIPTNAWWGNLITCDSTTNQTQPIWAHPYAITMETTVSNGLYGFSLSYPYRNRFFGDVSASGIARYYAHASQKEFIFSAAEFVTKTPSFLVTSWSDLGVQVQVKLTSTSPMLMTTNMVSGMAYVTMNYQALTPRIALQTPISTISGYTPSVGMTFAGTRLIFTTVAGQQWVLYASPQIYLTVETNMILRSTASYTGVLRLAAIFPETQVTVYDTYRNCIVTGADVDIPSDSLYSFQWQTTGDCTRGLLHFALPHHADTISLATVRALDGISMSSSTRGPMTAYITITSPPVWNLLESNAIPVTFYPKKRLTAAEAQSQSLLSTLVKDIQSTWAIASDGSFYFNGKAAQKYASLCLMANDPVIVGEDISLLRRCLTKLEKAIVPFLNNTWAYSLKYDAVFGGIVSSEGYVTKDINADFGNTVYNDHHYHYGYWVYTAAILNYLHPTWSRLSDLNTMTRLLLRDVATPNNIDPYFPKFRHFDWYRGHSYSHGVTTFADGKDEESTSEDVNFAFAMYLFGTFTGHERMATIGKTMTKVDARAINTYFLMRNDNIVHPANFIPNKVSGILFDNKVDYSTWFSMEKYCIHGIQMVPISPITEYVRTKTFIQEEWDTVLSKESIVTTSATDNPWLSLLYANYARIDKSTALQILQKSTMDDGLSRSWALYLTLQTSGE